MDADGACQGQEDCCRQSFGKDGDVSGAVDGRSIQRAHVVEIQVGGVEGSPDSHQAEDPGSRDERLPCSCIASKQISGIASRI